MPKVIINEVDQSRYIAPGNEAPVVILVPGTASFGPVFTKENPKVHTFVGANDLSAFYNMFGLSAATYKNGTAVTTITGDVSFDYVTNLLNKGATVKFYRLNEGEYAKSAKLADITIDGESVELKLSAKYTGKLGNYLIVDAKRVKDSTTDVILSVYRMSVSNEANIDTDDKILANLSKYNRIESYRVSNDINSSFYDNINEFEYISVDTYIISELVKKLDELFKNEKKTEIIYRLNGGADFKDTDSIIDSLHTAIGDSFENFADPYLFDFDFVTSGGFVTDDGYDTTGGELTIHAKMIALCEKRGDCEAILDTPYDFSADDVITYSSKINTSYATIYAPWCSSVSAATGRTVMMPPSYNFLQAILYGMSKNAVENQLWYVPAGVNRAAAPFIINPKYEIGSVILDKFQNNHDYRVNPIMRVRNYGYCIYGNSTCQQSVSGTANSALESLNVRLLANVIKKSIFAVCCGLAFEYNDSRLWTKFYAQMDVVLTYMKRHFGLYDYKIIMDTTTVTAAAMNERRVPGKIKISPQLAGEFFDIDFEIAPSGVSFSEEDNG